MVCSGVIENGSPRLLIVIWLEKLRDERRGAIQSVVVQGNPSVRISTARRKR